MAALLDSAPLLQSGEFFILFWCALSSACRIREIDVLLTRFAKGEYKMTESIVSLTGAGNSAQINRADHSGAFDGVDWHRLAKRMAFRRRRDRSFQYSYEVRLFG
jgi:uncharacterized protein YhfF